MKFALATTSIAAAVALSSIALPVFASEDLAKSKNCLACHNVDKKVVGPSYKEVAVAYKGDKDAVAKLTQTILKGTGKNGDKFATKFGPMPMMANAGVSEAEAKTLATWIAGMSN